MLLEELVVARLDKRIHFMQTEGSLSVVHNSPSLGSILSLNIESNLVLQYFIANHFNIIILPTSRPSNWSHGFRFLRFKIAYKIHSSNKCYKPGISSPLSANTVC
jgi:hypothetical protein